MCALYTVQKKYPEVFTSINSYVILLRRWVGSQHHVRAATVHGDVARWDLEKKKQLRDLYFFIHGKKAMTV